MEVLIGEIALLAVILLGLAVMVGKVQPADAFGRLGVFIVILCLAPMIACCLKLALVLILKPLLILVAAVVVVTVLLRVLLTMGS